MIAISLWMTYFLLECIDGHTCSEVDSRWSCLNPSVWSITYWHQDLHCYGNMEAANTKSCSSWLFSTFSGPRGWKLAENQLLPSTFPLDAEPENFVRTVTHALFSGVKPTPLHQNPILAATSKDSLVNILDLDPDIAASDEFVGMCSGSKILDGSRPLAHRYGGHQFGYWAGQLGDGRAHLLGEYVNKKGERWELQLKGSGKTPYSRLGDGRAVIRSSVREFLCSEAMYYLGIPTSRTVSLVVSEERTIRDQFYSGNFIPERTAVVLRLAQSWFRIGSFEILARSGETKELQLLADFVIKQYFPEVDSSDPNKYLAFYSEVVSATAAMVAGWQSVGFAHGVLNTDNFSILSVTIDYGPFGFLDEYEPSMTPNTSDDEKRYTYEKQPDVARFNLQKLGEALQPLLTTSQQMQMGNVIAGYVDIYKARFMQAFCRKLGLSTIEKGDEYLVALLLKMMDDVSADFTMTFRQLGDWSMPEMEAKELDSSLWSLVKLRKHTSFWDWTQLYLKRLQEYEISEEERRAVMLKVNPRYILRNWIAQKAITATERNDFAVVNQILQILSNPFQEQREAEEMGFADPVPEWAKSLRVSCSS